MSVVLKALSKAEKEKKQGIFHQYQEIKMNDMKRDYQKTIGWIIALNICIILILILMFIYYLFQKQQIKPVKVKKLTIMNEKPVTIPNTVKIREEFIVYKNYIQIPGGPEIKISGRIQDKNTVYILVGPEMYKIGDMIGDALLTDIQLRKVKIKYKEQEYEIPTV